MTREEAIELLNKWGVLLPSEASEAVDMAIEALTHDKRTETHGVCSDLISRADAFEAVCGVIMDEFDVSPTYGYEVAEKALSALPSAEAVRGEWTNEGGEPIKDKFCVYCSKCKEWSEYRTDYCPNCGADMRGKDNG